MSTHPNVSSLPALALFSDIFSNILGGTHPSSPRNRPSLLAHIVQTRRSSLLKPAIAKAWSEETRDNPNPELQHNGPSPAFCFKVLEDVFDAFTEDDLKAINQEADDEWDSTKEKHRNEIMELYGEHVFEGLANSLIHALLPLLSTLKVLTGMSFTLWAGGPLGGGMGLMNISSDFKRLDAPLVVPLAQEDLFMQRAHEWMAKVESVFLEQCAEAAATTLPKGSFRDSSLKNNSTTLQKQPETTGIPPNTMTCNDPLFAQAASAMPRLQPPVDPNPILPAAPNMTRPLHTSVDMRSAGTNSKRTKPIKSLPSSFLPPRKKQRISIATPFSTSLQSVRGPLRDRDDTEFPRAKSLPSPVASTKESNGTNQSTSIRSSAFHDTKSTALGSMNAPVPRPQPQIPQAQSLTKPGHVERKPSAVTLTSINATIKAIPASVNWLSKIIPDIVQVDIGPQYLHAVKCLIELEILYDSNEKRSPRLATTGRPEEIGKWIQSGRLRSCSDNIKIANLSKYSASWWKWWKNIQPEWRVYDSAGMPVSVVRDGETEDWSCLLIPGVNGLLSVVASLYWWGCAINAGKEKAKADGKGWDDAVSDCGWVLGRLILTTRKAKFGEAHVARESNATEAMTPSQDSTKLSDSC